MAFICLSAMANAKPRYVGGDISALPLYEQYNSAYKDVNGKNIPDLITWFVEDCGWNTFRVRIFVNPSKKTRTVLPTLPFVRISPMSPH